MLRILGLKVWSAGFGFREFRVEAVGIRIEG